VLAGTYHRCRNLDVIGDAFILDPAGWAAAAAHGRPELVVHSHPTTNPDPSPQDVIGCNASGLPWLIVQPVTGQWSLTQPQSVPLPLLGRPWVWGAADCWSLVRDWYALHREITLPDYPRPATPEQFQAAPLFDELWRWFGFRQLADGEQTAVGDVALMSIGGPGLNHVGVLVEQNMILHHIRGRLSGRDLYGGWLQKCTGRIVRYEDPSAIRTAGGVHRG
jgi:proteasome lid subunit RPN8/RPN11